MWDKGLTIYPKGLFGSVLLIMASSVLSACQMAPEDNSLSDVSTLLTGQTNTHFELAHDDEIHDISPYLQGPLTAKKAIQLTLLENKQLVSLYHNLGIKQADLLQAGLLKNPVLEVSTLFTKEPSSPNIALALVASLSDLLQKPLRQDVARSQLETEKYRVASAIIAYAGQTHRAYITHLASRKAASFAQQNLKIATASETLAKGLFEAGNISQTDYDKAKARVNQRRADLLKARAKVRQNRALLNEAMGLDEKDKGRWQMPGGMAKLPGSIGPTKIIKRRALQNSLTIAIARQELISFGLQKQLQRRQNLIPDLDLGIEYERDDGEEQVGPVGELTIPIFDHGQAKRLKAYHQLRQKEIALTGLMRAVPNRAELLAQKFKDQSKLLSHYRLKVLPDAKRLQQGALKNYNAMQQGAFDLLTAKEQKLAREQDYFALQVESWLTLTELTQLLQGHFNQEGAATMTNVNITQSDTPLNTGGH